MDETEQSSRRHGDVPFVMLSAVAAVALLLLISAGWYGAAVLAVPTLAAAWLAINHRDLLSRVLQTIPRDVV